MPVTAVWGLDIGQCALKAVKARASGQLVDVMAFDHIEYKKSLSTAGTDASATIREALQTFLGRNDVVDCSFSVSIAAGRAALVRFIKLPPVDRRKVPDIVRYEATQQIPFPLEDVIWDHQVIERNYAPGEELEVGLFAMRREAIFDFLSNLMVSGIEVENIQLSAVALYNCVRYDQPTEDGAIMAVDIGAENTNLVVVDANSVWTRSLPIGGNDFTRAIATKFGIDFDQAENLKRNMPRSGKAQELFETLRPSLQSLLDEIQRSAGYYRSLHKSSKFVKLLGFGAGFRMYGVQRFLEAGLAYPAEVFEKTNNIIVSNAVNQQFFKKNAPAFGPALGLVVQGLGFGGINTTLMPPTIIKERILRKKRPFLIAAAAMLAGAFAWPAFSAYTRPTDFGIKSYPVAKTIEARDAEAKEYNKRLSVRQPIEAELNGLIDLKARRMDQLDAFNILVSSIPHDDEYPIYIQSLILESGSDGYIKPTLITPESALPAKGRPTFASEVVNKVRLIKPGAAAKKVVARGSAVDADERRYQIEQAMLRRETKREERRTAMPVGPRKTTVDASTGTARSDLDFKITGIGQVADVFLETANPNGEAQIRALAKDMAQKAGVLYCEVVMVSNDTVWEQEDTHARLYDEPGLELGTMGYASYKKTPITTARIQWVYKKGAVRQAHAAPKAGQPPAGARPPGSPVPPPAAEAEPSENPAED